MEDDRGEQEGKEDGVNSVRERCAYRGRVKLAGRHLDGV